MLNSVELFESGMKTFPRRPYHISSDINYAGSGIIFANNDLVIQEAKVAVNRIAEDKEMLELFEDELGRLIDELKASERSDVDLNTALEKSVSKLAMTMIIGSKPTEANHKALTAYLQEVGVLFGGGKHFIMSAMPWLRYVPGPFKTTFDNMKARLGDLIDSFVSHFKDGKEGSRGIMSRMMTRKRELADDEHETEKLCDENIYAVAADFINGSIAPWSRSLVTVLLCILKHPEVQEKIHAELATVCPTSPPTDADRANLHYLQAAILEGLRYISVLTTTVPHMATEDTEFHGFLVPQGSTVFGTMGVMHHAENIWGDAWTFRPDRFLDASGQLLSKNNAERKSTRPFGYGPRMCSGYAVAEPYMFKYISKVLYHFSILPPAASELPDCDPRTFGFAGALVVPKICCRFEPRA